MSTHKTMLVIGECLMELIPDGDSAFHKTFAGDTYNSAVYAKRFSSDLNVAIFTAVGKDPISGSMTAQFQRHKIDCSYIFESDDALPGIYAISTDEQGERSFVYWRKDSAATQMMALYLEKLQQKTFEFPDFDMVYFSGISLSILSEQDKAGLIDCVRALRDKGAKVAFDPNYRARMWLDSKHAREWMDKAYSISDIAFPGIEDHEALYGHRDWKEVKAYLDGLGIEEQVIKCGNDGTHSFSGDHTEAFRPFIAAPKQIDSTAAGDSFSGTYLASRLSGSDLAQALNDASGVASIVVQHRGAIIPEEVYTRHFGMK